MAATGPGRAKAAGLEVSSGRGCLLFASQKSGMFQPLWWLDGPRVGLTTREEKHAVRRNGSITRPWVPVQPRCASAFGSL